MATFIKPQNLAEIEKSLWLSGSTAHVRNGIRWYEAGSNSSHVFYLGFAGGYMYERSSSEDGSSPIRRIKPGQEVYIGR